MGEWPWVSWSLTVLVEKWRPFTILQPYPMPGQLRVDVYLPRKTSYLMDKNIYENTTSPGGGPLCGEKTHRSDVIIPPPGFAPSTDTASNTLGENVDASATTSSANPLSQEPGWCESCSKLFKSQRGLRVHQRSKHPELYHSQNQPLPRSKARWSDEEMVIFAREEIANRKIRFINQHLHKVFPHRTLESIKGLRGKNVRYARIMADLEAEMTSQPEAATSLCTETSENLASSNVLPQTRGWAENLVENIDTAHLANLGPLSQFEPGKPSSSTKEAINTEYNDWISKWLPSGAAHRERRANPPSTKLNARATRRLQYSRIQNLYKLNRSACAQEVLSGAWKVQSGELNLKEVQPFWEKMFRKESAKDRRKPKPTGEVLWGLMEPLTIAEVGSTLKSTTPSAPGPDKLTLDGVKRIPIAELVSHYNLWLYAGYQPEGLREGITTLIPKIKGTRDPAKLRPITVSSFICRIFHRCLAQRMETSLPLGERQKAFRKVDGICHNIWSLRSLIHNSKDNLKELNITFLDVRKAFDSISHKSLGIAAARLGLPPPLITYISNLYPNCSTKLKVNGKISKPIEVRRGVRQGDPLSPLLFNAVMDWALSELDPRVGVQIGEQRINHLAFADDIILVSSTKIGMVSSINTLSRHLAKSGLEISAGKEGKSASMAIVVDGKKKMWTVDPLPRFKVNSQKIPALSITQQYKYLGINIDAQGARNDAARILTEGLAELSRAPLKPQQRLYLLRVHLLPKLQHGLVLSSCAKRALTYLDKSVRSAIRRWLTLPKDTPTAFYHAKACDGGLGITRLEHTIPILKRNRMMKLTLSEDPVIMELVKLTYFTNLLHKYSNVKLLNSWPVTDKDSLARAEASMLHTSVDGRGLSNCSDVPRQSDWVTNGASLLSGRDFIGAIKVRGNLLPTKVSAARGRQREITCDCCRRPESLGHILQTCPRTWGPRISRHDSLLKRVRNQACLKNWTPIIEPSIPTNIGLRRPDLVLAKGNIAFLVDATVVADNANMQLQHEAKVEKYNNSDIKEWIKVHCPGVDEVRVTSLTANWRGCLYGGSASFLTEDLGLPKAELSLLSAKINEKGYYLWCAHYRGTARLWNRPLRS
uniref:ribonuclease H n=1 Tax=Ciona intestinalis TaxID=7719 RepID=Q76IP0_CIOIN|nr:reverse transcriptase [Ciona intestinalis]